MFEPPGCGFFEIQVVGRRVYAVGCFNITLGQIDINSDNIERAMAQNSLKREHIAPVPDPHQGCCVAESVGRESDTPNPGLVAAALDQFLAPPCF